MTSGWYTVSVLVAVDQLRDLTWVVRVTNDVQYSRHRVRQKQTKLQLPIGRLLTATRLASSVATIGASYYLPVHRALRVV